MVDREDETYERLSRALAGRYRVLRKLERGGMATVYLADDLKHPRQVAIKVLSPEMTRALDHKRFIEEIELCARLQHPHIVPLFDSGRSDDLLFYIMPFVAGESLRARLDREGRLPVELAIQITREVAGALDYAHGMGRIHRDVKPGNILMTGDHAQLTDFGLARVVRDGTTRGLTESGVFVGTVLYMSPEQARAADRLDERADVYSLGCVLFEMLAGRAPYEGRMFQEILGQHALAPIPLIRDIRSSVPWHVDAAVTQALAKDPADRFATAGALSQALLRPADDAHASLADPATRRPERGILHHFPRTYTMLIGRTADLRACRELLRESPLTTLHGAGGSGKTRLAVELAAQAAAEFPDGLWFVDLSSIAEPVRIPRAVAAVVGVREVAGEPLVETLARALRDSRGLLVLDNCEHVCEACCELVSRILDAGSRMRVLATSRQSIGFPGELLHEVGPLSIPSARRFQTPGTLASSESVRLFVDRAARVRPGLELTDGNAATIAAICRRLDGLPLAIELAAARARVLTVEEILVRLDASMQLLRDPSSKHTARHRTLRASLHSSDELLPDELSRLFHRLGVFTGGWTLEAATAVTGSSSDEVDMLDALAQLVDRSIVIVASAGRATSRYRFLEPVRQYARERLIDSKELDAMREAHGRYFLDLAERAAPALLGPGQVEWLDRLELDHANLLEAAHWFAESDASAGDGLRLATALSRFWLLHSHFAIGRQVLARALATDPSATDESTRAAAQAAAGLLALFDADLGSARALYRDALDSARRRGDRATMARILVGYGLVESREGRHEAARVAYEESLSYYSEAEHHRGIAAVHNNLGLLATDQGRFEEARRHYTAALEAGRRAASRDAMTITHLALGEVEWRLGNLEAARGHARDALALAGEIGDMAHQASGIELAANLVADLGQPEVALRLHGAAARWRETTGSRREPGDEKAYVARIAELRERVGPALSEHAIRVGRSTEIEATLEEVRRWLGAPEGV